MERGWEKGGEEIDYFALNAWLLGLRERLLFSSILLFSSFVFKY